jgi:hypothetical protein
VFTGVLFAGIAAAWLVFLVPFTVRRKRLSREMPGEEIVFSPTVTIVHSGDDLAAAVTEADLEISTPLTRRAQLGKLRQYEVRAASRRRRVLIFFLLAELIVSGFLCFGIGAWWGALIPAGCIVLFLFISRFSVKTMRRVLDARREEILAGSEEETVAISITARDLAEYEKEVEISAPLVQLGSLWDPIPITKPTYISQPLAARTVRTIDLAPPLPVNVPVTNDTAQLADDAPPELREATG